MLGGLIVAAIRRSIYVLLFPCRCRAVKTASDSWLFPPIPDDIQEVYEISRGRLKFPGNILFYDFSPALVPADLSSPCFPEISPHLQLPHQILTICSSQFIIQLHATFNRENFLYFLLEPALGGELFAVYHKYRFHGSISKAKFYSASVVFSFEHLHERNVLYRDLKPENLLLEARGYCKLTDMGLAKVRFWIGLCCR